MINVWNRPAKIEMCPICVDNAYVPLGRVGLLIYHFLLLISKSVSKCSLFVCYLVKYYRDSTLISNSFTSLLQPLHNQRFCGSDFRICQGLDFFQHGKYLVLGACYFLWGLLWRNQPLKRLDFVKFIKPSLEWRQQKNPLFITGFALLWTVLDF